VSKIFDIIPAIFTLPWCTNDIVYSSFVVCYMFQQNILLSSCKCHAENGDDKEMSNLEAANMEMGNLETGGE
jgi:hypothetical protein